MDMTHPLARLCTLSCGALVAAAALLVGSGSAYADGPGSASRAYAPASAAPRRVASAPTRQRSVVVRSAEPRTAVQLAAMQGLTYTDARTYVVLSGATLRVRLYPGTSTVVIGGREYELKDRITRSGSDIQLTSRVSRFLQTRISQYRSEESSRNRVVVRPKYEPLPPLPVRVPLVSKTPKLDLEPAPVQPRRAEKRAASSGRGWVPGVKEREWKWVIIHHSDTESGDLAKYDDYHRNVKRWENGCGYHFVIGNGTLSGDGQVAVGPRWQAQLQGAHAKVPGNRYNEQGVGICLVGDFDKGTGRPSPAQVESLVHLLHWLSNRYDIDPADIKGHCDCCSTCCPGKNFPWDEVRRRL
jgi:hypothetical protein